MADPEEASALGSVSLHHCLMSSTLIKLLHFSPVVRQRLVMDFEIQHRNVTGHDDDVLAQADMIEQLILEEDGQEDEEEEEEEEEEEVGEWQDDVQGDHPPKGSGSSWYGYNSKQKKAGKKKRQQWRKHMAEVRDTASWETDGTLQLPVDEQRKVLEQQRDARSVLIRGTMHPGNIDDVCLLKFLLPTTTVKGLVQDGLAVVKKLQQDNGRPQFYVPREEVDNMGHAKERIFSVGLGKGSLSEMLDFAIAVRCKVYGLDKAECQVQLRLLIPESITGIILGHGGWKAQYLKQQHGIELTIHKGMVVDGQVVMNLTGIGKVMREALMNAAISMIDWRLNLNRLEQRISSQSLGVTLKRADSTGGSPVYSSEAGSTSASVMSPKKSSRIAPSQRLPGDWQCQICPEKFENFGRKSACLQCGAFNPALNGVAPHCCPKCHHLNPQEQWSCLRCGTPKPICGHWCQRNLAPSMYQGPLVESKARDAPATKKQAEDSSEKESGDDTDTERETRPGRPPVQKKLTKSQKDIARQEEMDGRSRSRSLRRRSRKEVEEEEQEESPSKKKKQTKKKRSEEPPVSVPEEESDDSPKKKKKEKKARQGPAVQAAEEEKMEKRRQRDQLVADLDAQKKKDRKERERLEEELLDRKRKTEKAARKGAREQARLEEEEQERVQLQQEEEEEEARRARKAARKQERKAQQELDAAKLVTAQQQEQQKQQQQEQQQTMSALQDAAARSLGVVAPPQQQPQQQQQVQQQPLVSVSPAPSFPPWGLMGQPQIRKSPWDVPPGGGEQLLPTVQPGPQQQPPLVQQPLPGVITPSSPPSTPTDMNELENMVFQKISVEEMLSPRRYWASIEYDPGNPALNVEEALAKGKGVACGAIERKDMANMVSVVKTGVANTLRAPVLRIKVRQEDAFLDERVSPFGLDWTPLQRTPSMSLTRYAQYSRGWYPFPLC